MCIKLIIPIDSNESGAWDHILSCKLRPKRTSAFAAQGEGDSMLMVVYVFSSDRHDAPISHDSNLIDCFSNASRDWMRES
jgi:hypothetical protein